MPDRVVCRVIKLGERCKQKRVSQRIQFLNRHKERFSGGDGTEEDDNDQGLLETEPHKTNALLAKIPGVVLETDLQTDVIEPEQLTDADVAAAALQNANLCHTNTMTAKIAGVIAKDLTPPAVTDNKGDRDGADSKNDNDSELSFDGPPDGDPQGEVVNLADEDEIKEQFFDAADNEQEDQEQIDAMEQQEQGSPSNDQDDDSTGAVRPRSRRIRKKREPTIIDFENRGYAVNDGYCISIQTC
jgi:hypothetical protein